MRSMQLLAIERTINIIDEELKHSFDLEKLSEKVGLSKYHLHRLFKSITGKSVMTYVRDRKLSCSLSELIDTDLKVIDIASEYQFEYEQSYIRAFKKKYNITPSHYRKLKYEMPIEQKIDINFLSDIGQGLILKPNMCVKPQFYIQGLKREIVHAHNLINQDSNKLAEEFKENYLPLMSDVVNKDVYFGLVLYSHNPEYSNDYLSGVEVTSIKQTNPPMVNYTIPMSEYIVFRYIGLHSPYDITYATLLELYNYIDQWRIDSAYQQSHKFHFEKMDLKICSDTYCEMDIYVPIIVK